MLGCENGGVMWKHQQSGQRNKEAEPEGLRTLPLLKDWGLIL